jgi:hypothetical protein
MLMWLAVPPPEVKRSVSPISSSNLRTPPPLPRQIETVRTLALYGAEDVARELCASIFLNQAHALASAKDSWLPFAQCVLLLGMHNLLARLLRATHGARLSASASGPSGDRLLLAFADGATLLVPPVRNDAGVAARVEHVAYWSERIFAAATEAQAGLQPWVEPAQPGAHLARTPLTRSLQEDPVGDN